MKRFRHFIGPAIKKINGRLNLGAPLLQNLVTGLIFIVFLILVIRYQVQLLSYQEWCDESETIVTAKMLAAGHSLYSEVFNHHGPLTFLPGYILEKFGNYGIQGHRIPIAILQLIALAAIYFSPLLKCKALSNIYTGFAASVMLLYLPEIYGQMYQYQVIAGLIILIVLAQYTLPSITFPSELTLNRVISGNLLIALLPFLAVIYIPIAAALFIVSLEKKFLAQSFGWLFIGIFFNIIFLLYIGSIPGFLAFHIYLNYDILPLYNGGQDPMKLMATAFKSATKDLSTFVILVSGVLALSKLASFERSIPWRSFFLGVSIFALLMRGSDFHGLPFFYASLALPIIFFINVKNLSFKTILIVSMLSIICLIKISLVIPEDERMLLSKKIPESTEFSKIAKIFTSKKDRIIAYSFANFEYIVSDRLPASGNFFYLPWQEKYNENPKFSVKIDACSDIQKNRPIVMYIDKLKLWNTYSWDSYAGCIQKIIDDDYTQFIPGRPYYIRKDIIANDDLSNVQDLVVLPTQQLGGNSPIKITMTPSHQNDEAGLKRIGVRFGTNATRNSGDAEISLIAQDGSEFAQKFHLSDLLDNHYYYFDLDSRRYTSGKISSISGGGIATWESSNKKGEVNTCIVYEYTDGRRRFTPGCPPL